MANENAESLMAKALRIIAAKWKEGISETAFRRWNQTYSEKERCRNADVLIAIANAFDQAAAQPKRGTKP